MCEEMKKQTLVTVLALTLLFSAIAIIRLVDVGIVYAQRPTEDMGKALHEAFQASEPFLLQQMGICPPNVTIISIAENQTFTTTNITLTFTVAAAVKTTDFAYSLNGQENKTVEGNTTLTGLSIGRQSVVVYATDIYGRSGASETINFTIFQQEEPEFGAVSASQAGEPLSSAYLVGVVGACAVAGATSLAVHSRRKKKQST